MNGHSNKGHWVDLDLGSATTSIQKYDNENTITIICSPIKKAGTITDSDGSLKGEGVSKYQASQRCFVIYGTYTDTYNR